MAALHFSGDPDADAFLGENPLALLIGFVLDQQVTVQKAFSSPLELSKRLGGLDAATIAAMDPDRLEEVFRARPALHRFPATWRAGCRSTVRSVASEYGGDAARGAGPGARDGADLERRLLALPGIGEMKARTMVGVLAKRLGVRPAGWEEFAPKHLSLGDVDSRRRCVDYQAAKRARKAALRANAAV